MSLRTNRPWPYLLAPVPALSIGIVIASELGGGPGRLGFMAACGATGSVVVVAAARTRPRPNAIAWAAALALAVVASTLLYPGRDGVRRWVDIGPFSLNASLLFTPVILVATWRLAQRGRTAAGLGMLGAIQLVHLAQPDAAQATGVAAAVMVGAATTTGPVRVAHRVAAAVVGAVLAAATWLRPDPLPGTAGVEDVVQTAFDIDLALGLAMVASLCALPLPFLLGLRLPARAEPPSAGPPLAAYLAALLVSTQIGEFPVPVAGYGASTIWSYYAAAAASVWPHANGPLPEDRDPS